MLTLSRVTWRRPLTICAIPDTNLSSTTFTFACIDYVGSKKAPLDWSCLPMKSFFFCFCFCFGRVDGWLRDCVVHSLPELNQSTAFLYIAIKMTMSTLTDWPSLKKQNKGHHQHLNWKFHLFKHFCVPRHSIAYKKMRFSSVGQGQLNSTVFSSPKRILASIIFVLCNIEEWEFL